MTVTKSRLNEEVPGHQKGFRFKIRLKGSQSHWSSQISGLQSGSREICSPTKLWSSQIRFKNVRFKKELTSRKFEFKGRQKISGWKWRFRFKIRFKGKMSPTKLWSSQYPVQNPGSRRIYLLQKVKGCRRGPAAMMRGSNMGIMPYWLLISLITWGLWSYPNHSYTSWLVQCHNITWGLGRIRTIATPLERLKTKKGNH